MTILLTVAEVAEELRVSERTVRRLIRARHLNPVYPTPGSPRIRRQDLELYVRRLAEWRVA